jgi:hypothetical protein
MKTDNQWYKADTPIENVTHLTFEDFQPIAHEDN